MKLFKLKTLKIKEMETQIKSKYRLLIGIRIYIPVLILMGLLSSCSVFLERVTTTDPYYPEGTKSIITRSLIHKKAKNSKFPNLPKNPTIRNTKTAFAIVEFTEEGKLAVKSQLSRAVSTLVSHRPENVIVYCHGWHNDASPITEHKLGGDLGDLDAGLHVLTRRNENKNMAIYVGWRGESRRDIGRWRTLGDRREKARKIGQSAAFTSFIDKIVAESRKNGSKVFVVGHSLGAAMVEKCAHKMITSNRTDRQLPAMYFLLASAEESRISKPLIASINKSGIRRQRSKPNRLLRPYVIAITSDADTPVKKYLPLSSLFIDGKEPSDSTGFTEALLTHNLKSSRFSGARFMATSYYSPSFLAPQKKGKLQRVTVIPKDSRVKSPAYWNFRIDGNLSGGHNDIYNGNYIAMIANFGNIVTLKTQNVSAINDNMKTLYKNTIGVTDKSSVNYEWGGKGWERQEHLSGIKLRMPQNQQNYKIILRELNSNELPDLSNPSSEMIRSSWQCRYWGALIEILDTLDAEFWDNSSNVKLIETHFSNTNNRKLLEWHSDIKVKKSLKKKLRSVGIIH